MERRMTPTILSRVPATRDMPEPLPGADSETTEQWTGLCGSSIDLRSPVFFARFTTCNLRVLLRPWSRSSCQHPLGTEILINFRPVDSLTIPDDFITGTLFHCGF